MSIATDLAAPSAPPAAQTREDANLLAGIGRRVREARERQSMARKTLSQSSNVSERYLAQLEAGEGNASVLLLRGVARGAHGARRRARRSSPDAGQR